jgi:hypothetical protein
MKKVLFRLIFTNQHRVAALFRDPLIPSPVKEACRMLFCHGDRHPLCLSCPSKTLPEPLQFPLRSPYQRRILADGDLDNLCSVHWTRVFVTSTATASNWSCWIVWTKRLAISNVEYDRPCPTGNRTGRVAGLVVAIADVDVFPLERAAAFGGVVQEGRVVLVPDRERQWKLAGWVDGAEDDACDCVSGLVAAIPGLNHGYGFVDPGHRHWRPRLQYDGGVGGCGAHSVDHGVHVA